jgi:hypothetical protein
MEDIEETLKLCLRENAGGRSRSQSFRLAFRLAFRLGKSTLRLAKGMLPEIQEKVMQAMGVES